MGKARITTPLPPEGPGLEYKSALKGIPGSTWETYSTFANTDGGLIVLGVAEDDDGNPFVEGVAKPGIRIQEIWNTLNNQQIMSSNLLRDNDVQVLKLDEKNLILMDVPRADRGLRPIFYKRMDTGTFKRNGEGDYRCTLAEVASMLRDRSDSTYDATLLEDTSFEDIDIDTFHAFRNMMAVHSPDHMWNSVSDREFAEMINAVGRKGTERPLTVAGLLMFGREHMIYNRFPDFMLDYREYQDNGIRWTFRIATGDGTWCGNVFNFYLRVSQRLSADVNRPRDIGSDMRRIDDTNMHKAVRECLLNALIHADYLGRNGTRIEKRPDRLMVTNPGLFRIPLQLAEKGGESDPRNKFIAKMFYMIGAAERAGSGVSFILRTWSSAGYREPRIEEDQPLQRVRIELPLRLGSNKTNDGSNTILELMRSNPKISINEISSITGMSKSTVYNRVSDLRSSGTIRREGGTRGSWVVNDY